MRQHLQKGLSIGNFVFILAVLMILALFGMKTVPMYIEYKGVKEAMNAMASERFDGVGEIRTSLERRLETNYVSSVKREDVTIRSVNGAYEVSVDYYVDKPLFANLTISGHFQYSIQTAAN